MKNQNNQIQIFIIIATIISSYLLPTSLNSQDFSTRGEIFDYEIGDIFHLNSEAIGFFDDGFQDVTNLLIIGKYYSPQSDTVTYIRDIQNRRRDLINGEFYPWVYSYKTDTITYTDLNSFIVSCYLCTTYTDSSYCNGRLVNYSHEELPNASLTRKYVVGCGMTNYSRIGAFSGDLDSTLVYYKKGSEEWGQATIVNINEEVKQENILSIYPNPATTSFSIKSDSPLYGDLSIYSLNGKLINRIELNDGIQPIDISELSPNIYILKFYLNDRNIIKKITVN